MQNKTFLAGCCGICCSACGLFVKNICEGCVKTQESVDSLNKEGVGCPVLECAVKNKIDVCSRDCDKFPCDEFNSWPIQKEWLEMFKSRNK